MRYETAGDPMTGLLWTKKTRQKIADELSKAGVVVSATTVGKILKELKYSLKLVMIGYFLTLSTYPQH